MPIKFRNISRMHNITTPGNFIKGLCSVGPPPHYMAAARGQRPRRSAANPQELKGIFPWAISKGPWILHAFLCFLNIIHCVLEYCFFIDKTGYFCIISSQNQFSSRIPNHYYSELKKKRPPTNLQFHIYGNHRKSETALPYDFSPHLDYFISLAWGLFLPSSASPLPPFLFHIFSTVSSLLNPLFSSCCLRDCSNFVIT